MMKKRLIEKIKSVDLRPAPAQGDEQATWKKHQGTRIMTDAKMIDLSRLILDEEQPRRQFPEDTLNELAASIAEEGVLEPLLVEYVESGDCFRVVAGARRYKAVLLLNSRADKKTAIKELPCIIKEGISTERRLKLQIIENMQRDDLTPIEKAHGLQRFKALLGEKSTWQDVGRAMGLSVPRIMQFISLLDLPPYIQEKVSTGVPRSAEPRISEKVARALLPLKDRPQQLQALYTEITESETPVSAQTVTKKVRGILNHGKARRRRGASNDVHIEAAAEKLIHFYGTKVQIIPQKKGGRIVFTYANSEDLTRLYDLLVKNDKGQS